MASPHYHGKPSPKWLDVTKQLIDDHPLFRDAAALLGAIDAVWDALWQTTVGVPPYAIPMKELKPRAQIVGDFFESVLAHYLQKKTGEWVRGTSVEKDLLYRGKKRGDFDTEIKTSGQSGGKIFGNRSYAQPNKAGELETAARKKRAGYYLCVNFSGDTIFMVRVGWIDAEDWVPQKAPTGQMSGLMKRVYDYKLIELPGPHLMKAPLIVIDGVGPAADALLGKHGLRTVGDVVRRLKAAKVNRAAWLAMSRDEHVAALDVDDPKLATLVTKVLKARYVEQACGYDR